MTNILTFDLEDWYHGNFLHHECDSEIVYEERVTGSTHKILSLLRQTNNKATFFVLGKVAEKFPDLIREIHQSGHEIASHSYEHRLVYNRTKEDFARDLQTSVTILKNIIGDQVIGFRAPYWSVHQENDWVWDVLQENGIKYDSSLYPFKTYLYGDNNLPRFQFQLKTPSNGALHEFPPTTLKLFGQRLPFCGGFYFRVLPYWFVKWAIKSINRKEKQPVVFYLHPYEIDGNKPRSSRGLRNNFILHANVRKAEKKLMKLLRDFSFVPIRHYLNSSNC